MKRFANKMDPRLTRSMPLLLTPPAPYSSPFIFRVISPRWPERRRSHAPRHFYVGGVRTKLIGADSYPNHHRSPRRLILCGPSGGSAGKITRSSSTAELSRTGVYCSHEDLRDHGRVSRRAASCEDVYRSTHTPGWDSRFSESGVSLNDSRTDLASLVGTEDVDGVSQCSFGSSSAFHEVTGDSELDRPDSDSLSVPSSLCGGHDHRAWDDPRCGADRSAHRKTRHDSGSREKFLAELTSSGRSSPDDRREFYHSTPTKRGSPVPLSIFPGEEDDLHFPAHVSKDALHPDPNLSSPSSSSYNQSRDSLRSPRSPSSPSSSKRKEKGGGTTTKTADDSRHRSTESIPASVDTVREALNRRRQEFFSSLQDCSRLEEQSPGESVQSWITTGHTQRRSAFTDPKTLISNSNEEASQGLLRSSSSAARTSVRERVAAIERGPSLKIQAERDGDCKVLEGLEREQQRSTSDSGEGVVKGKIGKKPSDSNEGVEKRWGSDSHQQAGSDDTYKQAASGSARLQTGRSSRENGAESLAPPTVVERGGAASFTSPSSSRQAPETASSPSEQRTRWSAESGGGGGDQLSPRFQKTTPLTQTSTHYPNSVSADVTGKKDAENINEEERKASVFVNEAENRLKSLQHSVDETVPATQSTFASSSGGYRSVVSGGDGLTSNNYGENSSNVHALPTAVVTDSDGRVTKREPTNIAPVKSEWKTSGSAVTDYGVNIAGASETNTSTVIDGDLKSSAASVNDRAATDWKTSNRAGLDSVTGVPSSLTDSDIVPDGESNTSVAPIGGKSRHNIDDKDTGSAAATEWKTRIVGAVGLQTNSDDHYSTLRTLEDGEGYRTDALLSDSRGLNNNNSSLQRGRREEGEGAEEERNGAAQERSYQNAQHTLVSQVTTHPSTTSPPGQDKNKRDSPSPTPHALHSSPTSTTTTTADSGYSTTTTTPTPTSSHYPTPTTPPPHASCEQQVECFSEGVNTHISAETEARQNFLNTNPALAATETEMERGAAAERAFVDRSEHHLSSLSPSSVTTREVSHHHRRHVHRTTVEKTVTTQHTVRHREPYNDTASSPTALREGGCVNTGVGVVGSSPAAHCDFVTTTDRTVSTTVREEDSEREETTDTTTTTRRSIPSPSSSSSTTPLRQQPLIPGGRSGDEDGYHPRPHGGSNTSATVQVTATTKKETVTPGTTAAASTHLYPQPATRQQHNGYTKEESPLEMAGSSGQMNASFSILDSLQEQLSLLSQEDVSFASPARSPRNCSQGWEYRDHAEATLPRTQHCYSDAEDKSDRVGGTSSVSITLNRSYADSSGRGEQHTTQISGSTFSEGQSVTESKTDYLHGHAWEARRDADLRNARVTQGLSTSWGEEALSSEDGEGGRGGRGARGDDNGSLPPSSLSQRTTASLWRRPASSSSSELDDSDGNYSSISTTESSQHQHGPLSESDFPPSETGGPEDYDNIHSFNDFVSGLKGQSTSDQPSLHHSVDMVAHDLRGSAFLRASFIQETILEADDESETADEANTTGDTTLSSFRSSLHFSVPPPQSTPRMQYVSPVPQIKLWSTDQSVSELTASEEKRQYAVSPIHPLQDLSDRLSSISGDLSYDLSRTMHDDSRHDLDLSSSRHSACSSPAPSDVSDGSLYSTSATAEVRKQAEQGTSVKSAELTPTHRLTRRNLSSAFDSKAAPSRSKKSQWVEEKIVLFQRLLNDFEWQSKSSEQQLLDEMCALETGRADNADVAQKSSELCDDLYRAFTREFLEQRQSHVCPFIEDHLPALRFKRFLRKKHNSKLKGNRTFRIRHRLAKLSETESLGGGGKSASDLDLSQHRHAPYSPLHHLHTSKLLSPSALRERLVSDVFTEDADVKKSFSSDSAYSTLSSATSRHISDLDSTWRSVCDSRGDVSSIATDVSMDDTDKLRSLSDVFDQLDVCEDEIDQALLDRLRVGHYKADTL